MAAVPRLRVMFSSRALSPVFGGERLTDLRLELKARIEGLRVGEHPLFEVWIHEDDPEPAGKTILEGSLAEIARADIVLVLYTGEAGSADGGSEIGICHAELQEALTRRRDVVSVISLAPTLPAVEDRDKVFQRYVAARRLIHTRASDRDGLFAAALRLVLQRAVELAKRGARPTGRRVDQGAALDWARLDLPGRAPPSSRRWTARNRRTASCCPTWACPGWHRPACCCASRRSRRRWAWRPRGNGSVSPSTRTTTTRRCWWRRMPSVRCM